ncbi:hypothetical protein LQF76_06585 [Gloeomargaritales cyanobacterium VI4D9]|nr:hypothetical protein LQF76_06585 [Gloeomargaritales cyanobacterium VI4D9]
MHILAQTLKILRFNTSDKDQTTAAELLSDMQATIDYLQREFGISHKC